jgi:hypothetical protein
MLRALLLGVTVFTCTLAVPASAADVDPRALVVQPADVPTGFRVDRDESGLRSNELEAKEYPQTRAVFARLGRVTGYQVAFVRGDASIEARSDLFRTTTGARKMLAWVDLEYRKSGVRGQRRAALDIGDEGWVIWAGKDLGLTLVFWRHGRVFSGLLGHLIPRERTIALAHSQQRRIAAAT